MKPIERVKRARAKDRPTFVDFLAMFEGFTEFHGDRAFGDDHAIVGGVALFDGNDKKTKIAVTVIGIERGKTTQEKIMRNFGMPHPEGYRKSLRLMRQAEKFGRPIINFVDTSGAYPGMGAEERGAGQAIAENLRHMMDLRVPVLTIIIGEGGSGGALALAVANEVHMLENTIYSVISPEGCASILWKDPARVEDAMNNLKCTAADLKNLGVIENIISEHDDFSVTLGDIASSIKAFLDKYGTMTGEELRGQRYSRFRKVTNDQ